MAESTGFEPVHLVSGHGLANQPVTAPATLHSSLLYVDLVQLLLENRIDLAGQTHNPQSPEATTPDGDDVFLLEGHGLLLG